MLKSVFAILILGCNPSFAKKTKRLFDYSFPVGSEAQTPNSISHQSQDINSTNHHQINIGESNIHNAQISEKVSAMQIEREFMGNFPELINQIDTALNLIKEPTRTSLNEIKGINTNGLTAKPIEISNQKVYESSVPDIQIFDQNQ